MTRWASVRTWYAKRHYLAGVSGRKYSFLEIPYEKSWVQKKKKSSRMTQSRSTNFVVWDLFYAGILQEKLEERLQIRRWNVRFLVIAQMEGKWMRPSSFVGRQQGSTVATVVTCCTSYDMDRNLCQRWSSLQPERKDTGWNSMLEEKWEECIIPTHY